MKKIFTLACIGLLATACMNKPKTATDTSAASADTVVTALKTDSAAMKQSQPAYVGTFKGDIPSGSESLTLSGDMTYEMTDPIGTVKQGKFTVSGDTITLSVGNRHEYYMLRSDALEKLDRDRKPYKDAAKYMLKKTN